MAELEVIDQWVSEILAYSSHDVSYCEPVVPRHNSVWQIIGKPCVYPAYSYNRLSWKPDNKVSQKEFITFRIPESVYITSVNLYETNGPGACVEIEAKNEKNNFISLWKGINQQTQSKGKSRIFSPQLKKCEFKSNEIRVTFAPNDYMAIDAIRVDGVGSISNNEEAKEFATQFHLNAVSREKRIRSECRNEECRVDHYFFGLDRRLTQIFDASLFVLLSRNDSNSMFYNIPKEIIYPIITIISKPNHYDFSMGEFTFLFTESNTSNEYYSCCETVRLYFKKDKTFRHHSEFYSEDQCTGSTDRRNTIESGSFKVISDGINIDKVECEGIIDNKKNNIIKRSFEIHFNLRKDVDNSQKRKIIGIDCFLMETNGIHNTYRLI